jgi:predicted oxidoreductase
VLRPDGQTLPGLYAAGFGGGVHGSNSLEGTVLGGCPFLGHTAGRAAAAQVA